MNSNDDDELGFIRRYAAVLRPEAVYDQVVAAGKKARAKDIAARPVPLRPQHSPSHPAPVPRRYAAQADLVLPLPVREQVEAVDRYDEALRALLVEHSAKRPAATEQLPQSDLEFYQRCAAATTQLS